MNFLEKEFSIKLPIQNVDFLQKIFKDLGAIKQNKYIEFEVSGEDYGNYEDDYISSINSTPTIERIICEGNKIISDKKTIRRRESKLLNINNIFALCEYKESIEEYIFIGVERKDLLIQRYYLIDENNLRWALENPVKMWGDQSDDSSSKYFNTNLNYLHVECENCNSFEEFENFIIQSKFNYLISEAFFKHENFKQILKNDIVIKRKFVYTPIEEYKIFAPKLDGIREPFILFNHQISLYKSGKSFILETPLNKNQVFFGCAEIVNEVIYLIDILKIFGPTSEYCTVEILDSIKILKQIKILNPKININKFTFKQEAIEIGCTPGYDGALAFGASSILKLKNMLTIDLLNHGNEFYFKNGEKFKDNFQDFVIVYDFDKNVVKSFKNFKNKRKIIEFDIYPNKLVFFKERDDKYEANTIEDFRIMLSLVNLENPPDAQDETMDNIPDRY